MSEAPRPTLLDLAWRFGLKIAYRLMLASWFVLRPRHRGALVAIWHGGDLLVIRNSYRRWLSLPGGSVKRSETPIQAAVREVREEIGLEIVPADLRFVADIPMVFEYQRDLCTFFELHVTEIPHLRLDGREVVWAGFLPESEADGPQVASPVRAYLALRRAGGVCA